MTTTLDRSAAGSIKQERRANRPFVMPSSPRLSESVRSQRLLTRIRRHETSGDQAVATFSGCRAGSR